MKKTHRVLLVACLWIGLCFMAVPAVSAPLEEALQSGDLRYWRDLYATPPPDAKWFSALRASPIYWLLSPMAWCWLLMICAWLVYRTVWRLSAYGELGLLNPILA
ncbi:MAG: hypothetical protein ACREDX_09030, partial [Aestuariivirga sp.]